MRVTSSELRHYVKTVQVANSFISFPLLLCLLALASTCTAEPQAKEQHLEKGPPASAADKTLKAAIAVWGSLATRNHDDAIIKTLPASFDARTKWPNCPSINDIYDQGSCGSCWAVSSAPAITDRYCIASNGTNKFQASIEDALTCSEGGDCTTGGAPWLLYSYWKTKGIVSGGAYDSGAGCKPYTIPLCKIHGKGHPCPLKDFQLAPKCKKECVKGYSVPYEDDRHFASDIYKVEKEDNMKAEIYLHGPVTGDMDVYEDFARYAGGVYRHREGDFMYAHSFKLIGWGEDEGLKYWLATNSWNVEWGEKGICKIAMGKNVSGVEDYAITGLPDLSRG